MVVMVYLVALSELGGMKSPTTLPDVPLNTRDLMTPMGLWLSTITMSLLMATLAARHVA